VYENNPRALKDDTKQDSSILNIQRACEACIDLAMHIICEKRLGLPKTSHEAFELLEQAELLPAPLAESLIELNQLKNTAVRDYQSLDLNILQSIIEEHLNDFTSYTSVIMKIN
jgi:uncharacterized protein YutE (UPF0331/DUF86 family)